jgi:hypothetical protein
MLGELATLGMPGLCRIRNAHTHTVGTVGTGIKPFIRCIITARSLVLERIREVNTVRFKPFKMPSRVGGGDSGIVQPRNVAPGRQDT